MPQQEGEPRVTRPVAIDDFYKIQLVSDPQVAPDGSRIAFVVKRIDRDKNKYRSAVYVVPTAGGEPRRYTNDEVNSSHPRWSPDGQQIAFLSDRQEPKSQIFLIPADGGEASPLTKLETEGGIEEFCWSPDGSKIAFLFRETPADQRKEAVEERQKKGLSTPVRHHTRLWYRLDAAGYFDGSYPQVWVADAATGESKPLTSGPYACHHLTWSPDSQTIAFLSDRRDDYDIALPDEGIWTVPASGGDLTRLTAPPGDKSGLTWSPDGASLAYAGNPSADDPWGTNNERLFVLPASGSDTARDLTGHTELSLGHLTLSDSHEVGGGAPIQWSADGTSLLFLAGYQGNTSLYRVPFSGLENPTGDAILLQGHGEVGDFHAGKRLAFSYATATALHELFLLHREMGQNTAGQLTHLNTGLLAEWDVQTPEPIAVTNNAGGQVPGWLLKPHGFKPGDTYPLVVYVHGGPHAQYGNTFFHELQWLASEGFVVLYTNPRGSKGYGEAHTKAIIGDWGGPDFDDIMTATDYAVSLDFVDAKRTAIMGGSYGGFMTAWAVGHTDRYTCAIADRLVANLQSMAGTSDFPWRHGDYFKGNAWSDPTDLWRHSPLTYAGNIVTPLLLIHSDGDLRCPAGQAEELFSALRIQRKTVEYLRFPAESSHGLSRNGPPDLRLQRLEANRDWLKRWLQKA